CLMKNPSRLIFKPTTFMNQVRHIFPIVQYPIEYKLEVFIPRVRFLNTNLTAFLKPFTFQVWLCVLTTIFAISSWLLISNGVNLEDILLWQFSNMLEQDGIRFSKTNKLKWGVLIAFWVFFGFLIRQLYCSYLYSFMTAEIEPKSYPKTLNELQDYNEFKLLTTQEILETSLRMSQWQPFSAELANFYLSLLRISYIIVSRSKGLQTIAESFHNISEGKGISVRTYDFPQYNGTSSFYDIVFCSISSSGRQQFVEFNKFVSICRQDCFSILEFIGQQRLTYKSMNPVSAFSLSMYWVQFDPDMQTFRFARFLGSFVQSGLYDLATRYYNKFERLRLLDFMAGTRMVRPQNKGTLFSFVFLGGKATVTDREIPTNISAMWGTFIISAWILMLSLFVLILEVQMPVDILNLIKSLFERLYLRTQAELEEIFQRFIIVYRMFL
ncbi:unnamed protein product, partial [Orchesella dallaii]